MGRRNQRRGDYLATDDYTGFTRYASQLRKDFWGSYAVNPLKRNLQEIATPLDDPAPLSFYRGPSYESYTECEISYTPVFVGNTNVPTNTQNVALQTPGFNPGIGEMIIGCNFIVR